MKITQLKTPAVGQKGLGPKRENLSTFPPQTQAHYYAQAVPKPKITF